MTCKACTTIPPVATDYEPQGTYETIAGLKTYITTPPTPKSAIITIYDVFGPAPQTLQGADILSQSTNAIVLIPDVLQGDYACSEWTQEEKREFFPKLLRGNADPVRNVKRLSAVLQEGRERFPFVDPEKWGCLGLCWGGKVVALASSSGTPFAASAQVHPGQLNKTDAENLAIPHIVLASKNEPVDAVKDYQDVLASNGRNNYIETYPAMWHGWMGSRADLKREESRREFLRGYARVAEFFRERMG